MDALVLAILATELCDIDMDEIEAETDDPPFPPAPPPPPAPPASGT